VGLASSLQQWQAWQLLKFSLRSCTTSFSPWKMMSVFFVFLVHFYVFLIVIMFINYVLCLQGIVDHHFKDCYNLKEANGPFLFIELLPTYISDSETTLEEMTTELYVWIFMPFSLSKWGLFLCFITDYNFLSFLIFLQGSASCGLQTSRTTMHQA
jgi:hypothetical protein